MTSSIQRWSIPAGQRLLFEDFDDGVVMFDALVGATHLLNASAAETLTILVETPGIAASAIHTRLLDRLGIAEEVLPLPALNALLWQLEHLNMVCACAD